MRRFWLAGMFILAGAAGLFGCGSAGSGGGGDFEAGNRLLVASFSDSEDHATPVFNGVEQTDDSGEDGEPDTNDLGEGDHLVDPGENILVNLSDDLGKLVLTNEPRLGVDPGVDLQVYRVDLTYYDALGRRRSFAPRRTYQVTGTVPNEGSAEMEIVLIPVDMKSPTDVNEHGIRWYFLNGTADQIEAVRTWTVVADVYARDIPNDRSVHAQGRITVRFINPMIEQVID